MIESKTKYEVRMGQQNGWNYLAVSPPLEREESNGLLADIHLSFDLEVVSVSRVDNPDPNLEICFLDIGEETLRRIGAKAAESIRGQGGEVHLDEHICDFSKAIEWPIETETANE